MEAILALAGLPSRPAQHLDGASLLPLLGGGPPPQRDALFWHYPHYANQGGFPGGAIRLGRWKLLERYEDGRVQLYDRGRTSANAPIWRRGNRRAPPTCETGCTPGTPRSMPGS